jgi:hypothetical protein
MNNGKGLSRPIPQIRNCVIFISTLLPLTPFPHPIFTLFPTDPTKVLPCPAGSHISNQFLVHGLLIALMMEAASNSETSVNFYQTIWCNIPEDSCLHTCHHENLKSHSNELLSSIKGTEFLEKLSDYQFNK